MWHKVIIGPLRRITLVLALLIVSMPVIDGVCEERHGWDEGAPLPADAVKTTSEIRSFSSPLDTGYQEISLSGKGIDTFQKALATDLKKLQEQSKGIRIEDEQLRLRIIFESDLLFDFDKAAIRPDAEATLSALVPVLKGFKDKVIKVVGHTDSKGSDTYNQTLSTKRADSVRSWLLARSELRDFRFEALGRGETQPIASNSLPDGSDDPAGRQKNRRVEIEIPKH
jgi:outer membrane protein OmpA-like peptidoglycan-associated protein